MENNAYVMKCRKYREHKKTLSFTTGVLNSGDKTAPLLKSSGGILSTGDNLLKKSSEQVLLPKSSEHSILTCPLSDSHSLRKPGGLLLNTESGETSDYQLVCESFPLVDYRDMPLRLPKLRVNKGSKVKGAAYQGESASLGSQASITSNRDGKSVYVVSKLKDLPKLHQAVWKEDLAKVKSITRHINKGLLNAHDTNKRTALHYACAKGLNDIIIYLCATCKADTNVTDAEGATPMHRVIESGNSAPLKHLLDCGGNPNLADKNGNQPLHTAAHMADYSAAALLLERGVNIDAIDKDGWTALHIATANGHQEFVSSLIKDGADINCQDGSGKTCLMMACSDGRIGIIQLLCDNHANPSLKDHTSFKAIDYAITRNNHDCARIVEQHQQSFAGKQMAHTSQKGSLIDPALIHASYGVGGAGAASLDGGPALGYPHSPAHSENTPSMREPSPMEDNSWATSDTEDFPKPPSTIAGVSLLAGLSRPIFHDNKEEEEEEEEVVEEEEHVRDIAGERSLSEVVSLGEDYSEPAQLPPAEASSSPRTLHPLSLQHHNKKETIQEEQKKEVKETFPLPVLTDEEEENLSDFDSDISDLLSEGGYIPSSASGGAIKERGSSAPSIEPIINKESLLLESEKIDPNFHNGSSGAGGLHPPHQHKPVIKQEEVEKPPVIQKPLSPVSQVLHKPVSLLMHNPLSQDLVSQGQLNPVSRDVLNPVSPGVLSPVSPGILSPVSPGILNLVSQDSLNPMSPNLLNPVMVKDMPNSESKESDVLNPIAQDVSDPVSQDTLRLRSNSNSDPQDKTTGQEAPCSTNPPLKIDGHDYSDFDSESESDEEEKRQVMVGEKGSPPSNLQQKLHLPKVKKESNPSSLLFAQTQDGSMAVGNSSYDVDDQDNFSDSQSSLCSKSSVSIMATISSCSTFLPSHTKYKSHYLEGTRTALPPTPSTSKTDIDDDRNESFQNQRSSPAAATNFSLQSSRMEQQNMQLELENRELKCSLDQAREGQRINELITVQLREQMEKLEGKLNGEMEGRQAAELRVRELEVSTRTLQLAQKQLEETAERLKHQIQAETEARAIQEGIYQEQVRVFHSLQSESEKTQGYQEELQNKLGAADVARAKAEEKLHSILLENSKLKHDCSILKQKGEECESQLEAEIDQLRTQLQETKDNTAVIEASFSDSQQVFQRNLKELQEKAHMLSTALDREADEKSAANTELARLHSELEHNKKMLAKANEKEKLLNQQLEQSTRENSLKGYELKSSQETAQQQSSRLEALDSKLHVTEANLKSFETLASERAHQLSTIEQSLKQAEERMSLMEKAMQAKEGQLKDIELKYALSTERTAGLQLEKEQLIQQIEYGKRKLEDKEEGVAQVQDKYNALVGASREDQQKMNSMGETISLLQMGKKGVEEQVAALKEDLSQARDTINTLQQEKEGLILIRSQLVTKEAELEAETEKVVETTAELEHLSEVRGTLEGVVSEQQGEIIRLTNDLGHTKDERDKSLREAQQARNLWESEIKSRTLLGQKVEELQKTLVAEKRRTRKAIEKKKNTESHFEPLQVHYSQLQDEVSSLKSQLKSSKQRIKQLQEVKGGWEDKKASLLSEVQEVKGLLETTRDQLKREGEARMMALKDASRAKHDLELSRSQLNQEQGEVVSRERNCRKLEHANKRLKEEVKTLQEHIAHETISRMQMEAYKKEVDEKAKRDLCKKLEEVNCHMDQQLQAQQALVQFKNNAESEWKAKFEQAREEMRELKAQFLADKEANGMENTHLKELYEGEARRSEKLSNRLRKSKDEADQYRSQLGLEHRRTQRLIGASQAAASAVTSSGTTGSSYLTSTPKAGRVHVSPTSSANTEELLNSVRTQLDNSIARHLEGGTFGMNKATRSTYGNTYSVKNGSLDSIRRNYHI